MRCGLGTKPTSRAERAADGLVRAPGSLAGPAAGQGLGYVHAVEQVGVCMWQPLADLVSCTVHAALWNGKSGMWELPLVCPDSASSCPVESKQLSLIDLPGTATCQQKGRARFPAQALGDE